ncbi:site-specific integrase [Firmicutes bacterium AM55-24TS]|nr:site-specific integrase [Firmicutes bacterium AM55-24TS]
MKKRLNEWVYEWLETYKKVMVKKSTYDSYLQYATHVTCDKSLKKLSNSDIQKLINNMVVDGLKLSTIKHMLTLVRQSLKKARSLGLVKNLSMLEDLDLPKKQPKKIKPLRSDEINRFLKNSYLTFYGDFYKALLFTGCRVGELIALRWSDVDFFNGVLRIEHTDYKGELQAVKTAHGCRQIPLYGELLTLLTKRRRRAKGSEMVFTNTLGRPISYRTVLDNWHWYLETIGIYEPLGFHVLRHTFAHTALRSGIPIKVVSAWLGHADVQITLNIYDSIDETDFLKATKQLEQSFA